VTLPTHRVFAVGRYQSSCAVSALPRQNVQRMLPPQLSLAEQTLTNPDEHPVLFMFGSHSGVKPVFLPISGSSYREFILAIPYLRSSGRRFRSPDIGMSGHLEAEAQADPVAHMSRLYLDKWAPTMAGWVYAYPKQRARIRSTENSYSIASYLGGRPLIRETTVTALEPPQSSPPDFSVIAPMFEQPFVQTYYGGLVACSVMTFHLDSATIRSATMQMTIEKAFLPGLEMGEKQFPGIDQTPLGSFQIDVSWSLSYPMTPGSLAT